MCLDRVLKWRRPQVLEETEVWLRRFPQLPGLFQYTFTVSLEAYAKLYPHVLKMGVRVPSLTDAVLAYLEYLHSDPTVRTGRFLGLSRQQTAAIVLQHTSLLVLDAITTVYFPEYSPATSRFARQEAEFDAGGQLPTPVAARPLIVPGAGNRRAAQPTLEEEEEEEEEDDEPPQSETPFARSLMET